MPDKIGKNIMALECFQKQTHTSHYSIGHFFSKFSPKFHFQTFIQSLFDESQIFDERLTLFESSPTMRLSRYVYYCAEARFCGQIRGVYVFFQSRQALVLKF
jgi:hypothetical protein